MKKLYKTTERKMKISKREMVFVLTVISFFVFNAVLKIPNPLNRPDTDSVKTAEINTAEKYFSDVSIEARSAIVFDPRENKIIYGKNESAQLPLASLTKIMTALVALEGGAPIAVVSREAVAEEGESGLYVGEKWQLSELAKLTLVSSANDGASSMAAAWMSVRKPDAPQTFTEAMNNKAGELGLAQTYFLNETGLDVSKETAGAYGSLNDLSKLFYKTVILYPDIFSATSRKQLTTASISNKKHTVLNTNGDTAKIPGLIASKTGFTSLSGGNLIVMIDSGINHPLIIGVLGSSLAGRFSDVEKLTAAAILAVGNE